MEDEMVFFRGFLLAITFPAILFPGTVASQIIIDHNCARLKEIPLKWVDEAKKKLHIAYGHTSHGSQITEGMKGLVGFVKGGGGPRFKWNWGGAGGALDLRDKAFPGDLGNYPGWYNYTRAYLKKPGNKSINVIMWSWCGQVSNYTRQEMITKYLRPMSMLEMEFPNVKFVYMTGHLNHWRRKNTLERNEQIREYCRKFGKILYDFADIESYNPDGIYYADADDGCNYYDRNGRRKGNWAEEWQRTHRKGIDWYDCYAAHSKPLNGNLKAFAAWWLWARLAGWPGKTAFTAERDSVWVKTGGKVKLYLNAGTKNANAIYVILGSMSGNRPGFTLPGMNVTVPLNMDEFTNFVIFHANSTMFKRFFGRLDSNGTMMAELEVQRMSPYMAWYSMSFAYVLVPLNFASNPISVRLID